MFMIVICLLNSKELNMEVGVTLRLTCTTSTLH